MDNKRLGGFQWHFTWPDSDYHVHTVPEALGLTLSPLKPVFMC